MKQALIYDKSLFDCGAIIFIIYLPLFGINNIFLLKQK